MPSVGAGWTALNTRTASHAKPKAGNNRIADLVVEAHDDGKVPVTLEHQVESRSPTVPLNSRRGGDGGAYAHRRTDARDSTPGHRNPDVDGG
jgi:hypothetical protein